MLRLNAELGLHFNDATNFAIHYGGAEANVAVNLANNGYDASLLTKIPENQLGTGVKQHLRKYSVKMDNVIEGGNRLGIYFLNYGASHRSSTVLYDRENSSFCGMTIDEVDIDKVLDGVTLFHVTGITPALSDSTRELTKAMMVEAEKRGIKISYDMNHRSRQWTVEEHADFLKNVAHHINYLSATPWDAWNLLGIPQDDATEIFDERDYYNKKIVEKFPNIEYIYSTIRTVNSATNNSIQGALFHKDVTYYSKMMDIDLIIDRVGGGDAYAAGILHGIMTGMEATDIVNLATAYSSLKHTVYGDMNPFKMSDAEYIMDNSAAIIR